VVQPQRQSVVQTLTASGQVRGAWEADLAPEMSGVLAEVLVEEGALVRPGQLVARLTQGVPTAEFQQAVAAVSTADASLAEAQGSAAMLAPSIRQAQAEGTGAVRQAEARLQQARERLGELQAGGTAEERQQAAAAVAQGELRVTQARREVQRTTALAEADATAAAPPDAGAGGVAAG
jgi:HlyD family secretion protein